MARQTAYHLENKQAGVALSGHSGQKTSFSSGSIIGQSGMRRLERLSLGRLLIRGMWLSGSTVKQNGHAVLTITLPGGKQENYLITLRESRAPPEKYRLESWLISETSHDRQRSCRSRD